MAILLTALGSDTDRIVGLEIGADDYFAKPFNPRELLARISAVLISPPAGFQRDLAQRIAAGALFVPKPTQHILALRTQLTEQRVHRRAIELPGRIVPSPNASGLVQASIGGRLSPPTGGFKPLGTPVKAGDILAYVRPP